MAFYLRHKITIIALLVYWPAMFILTHLAPANIPRIVFAYGMSDKVMHFFAYLALFFLLWFALWPDKKVDFAEIGTWSVLAAVVVYGAIDEWLQFFTHRSPDTMDFVANMAGVLTAMGLLIIFSFWSASLIVTASFVFILSHLSSEAVSNTPKMLIPTTLFIGYTFYTVLWMRYIHLFLPPRPPEKLWLFGSFAMPFFTAVAIGCFLLIAVGDFVFSNLIAATSGIVFSILCISIFALFKNKYHKVKPFNEF